MRLFRNNFSAVLETGIDDHDMEMELSRGDLPVLAAPLGDHMLLTLEGEAGEIEIVRVFRHDTDSHVHIVTRGKEGTEPRAWPAGTKVENRVTAGTMEALSTMANANPITNVAVVFC
jgi:hypothetical protein